MPSPDTPLTLETKSADERRAYLESTMAEYRQELLDSGLSPERPTRPTRISRAIAVSSMTSSS